jgi:UDP-N-acetylmuramoyl-L-alanyl-D-glutamate--2,6-diaminopimelate ligase
MQPTYCVLNQDDSWYKYFTKQSAGACITYGRQANNDVAINKVRLAPDKTDFELQIDGKKAAVQLQLAGEFNVYNATAAAAATSSLGLTLEKIAKGLTSLDKVPGRMENVTAGQNFTVTVDYAYTPDALAKTLQALQNTRKGRIILVFGACGDRDKGNREPLGEAAAKYADHIFLTDDETYTEDPGAIRKAVMKGIVKAKGKKKTAEIPDRRDAIKAAFKVAKKGDVVLLTGIGHQNYRNMGGKKLPWDERKIAKQLLK